MKKTFLMTLGTFGTLLMTVFNGQNMQLTTSKYHEIVINSSSGGTLIVGE